MDRGIFIQHFFNDKEHDKEYPEGLKWFKDGGSKMVHLPF